jgi:trans-aconitate 2-methyltransferase
VQADVQPRPKRIVGRQVCYKSRWEEGVALNDSVTEDSWNPGQYGKFAAERARPFFDLLALVEPVPDGRVVDLGCGTGELTARLHAHTRATETLGVDSSEAMLAQAGPLAGDGLRFEIGDISRFDADPSFDVIFTNAALQWVADHPRLLARLAAGLRPGGQLAVQVPANADQPSHTVAAEVAKESPFLEHMREAPAGVVNEVLTPERYAELLNELGFCEQHVRLQVYGHHMASTAAVVEWTKGTAPLRFQRLLPGDVFDAFVLRYQQRLVEVLGDRAPYFYPFKRILFWARLAAA